MAWSRGITLSSPVLANVFWCLLEWKVTFWLLQVTVINQYIQRYGYLSSFVHLSTKFIEVSTILKWSLKVSLVNMKFPNHIDIEANNVSTNAQVLT